MAPIAKAWDAVKAALHALVAIDHGSGAPRATRPRRVLWWVAAMVPAALLVGAGTLALVGGGNPLGWAVISGGAACAASMVLARMLYVAGYYSGSTQRTLDSIFHTPEVVRAGRVGPHPADGSRHEFGPLERHALDALDAAAKNDDEATP